MQRLSLASALGFIGLTLTSLTARADFNPIATPTLAYTSSTTKIDIGYITNGTTGITDVTDGTQTVSFDVAVEKTAVGVNWSTWNTPPNVESSTPPLLMRVEGASLNQLTLNLSVPSTTFGFELQGNMFLESQFVVEFLDESSNLVGQIDLLVNGQGGALLFAASTTTSPFSSIKITNPNGNAEGFAIAQLRYTAVPEPASIAMIVQAIAAVGFYGLRKRRQLATVEE